MLTPRQLLRAAARRFGVDLVPYPPAAIRPLPVAPLVFESLADQLDPVLQIGANDGLSNDPVRALIARHDLRALLVEPIPALAASLRSLYAGVTRVRIVEAAVGTTDGEATLYRVRPEPSHPAWLQQVASFDRAHVAMAIHEAQVAAVVEPLRVPVVTVGTLLHDAGWTNLGLMQIDTEGHDAVIVHAVLRAGHRPRIIHYEHAHVGAKAQLACLNALGGAGYAALSIGGDTLAIHNTVAVSPSTPTGPAGRDDTGAP